MLGGILTLVKVILRQERLKLTLWVVGIVGLLVAMVPMLSDLYGDSSELGVMYKSFESNPAGLFITGPMDYPTFGGLMTIETIIWWGIAIALLNTFFIVRHTRRNEESDIQDIVMATPVSRTSGLWAAVLIAIDLNIIISVLIGLSFSFFTDFWTVEQAWLYGIAFGSFGLLWSGIAAVAVQLFESARTVNGFIALLLGLSFVLRGIGDSLGKVGPDGLLEAHWVSYISPLGWLQQARPLTAPEWWPVVLMLVATLVCFVISFTLLKTRDVGGALLRPRPGNARSGRLLRSLLGLAIYTQRNIALAYSFGLLLLTSTVGVLAGDMTDILDGSKEMSAAFLSAGGQGEMVESFLSTMLVMAVILVVGYVINGLEKMKSEEIEGRLDNLLSVSVSRQGWMASHVLVAIVISTLMLMAAGGILALIANASAGMDLDVLEYTLAGLSYVPLILLIAGVYLALYGLAPKIVSVLIWVYFGFMTFIAWIGPVLQLDDWIMKVSVLSHMPIAPLESPNYQTSLVLTLVGLGLMTLGFIAWRRRDLVS